MSVVAKKPHTSNIVEVRIGSKKPRIYLVPKKKAKGIESLLSDYRAEDESVSLDEAFRELNYKYSKQGNVLCGLRLKKGWTQAELAKKIGTSQANVAAIENGNRKIGKNLAQKLAEVFKTSYSVFFGGPTGTY